MTFFQSNTMSILKHNLTKLSFFFLLAAQGSFAQSTCEAIFQSDSSDVILSLKKESFDKDPFSEEMFNSLHVQGSQEKTYALFNKSKQTILENLSDFYFQNKTGEQIVIRTDLLMLNSAESKEPSLGLIGSFNIKRTGQPIGFFVFSFPKNKNGTADVFLNLIKMNLSKIEGKGIANEFIPFIAKKLSALGFSRLYLEADWLGRIVWAKKNFEFDPETFCFKNGQPISQISLARENLDRFLNANRLDITDLEIVSGSEKRRLTSLSELNSIQDFVNLTHVNGHKLKIRPYIDENTLGEPTEYDIGLAFSLSLYEPRAEQTLNLVGIIGDPISDQALFSWKGFLRLDQP